MTRGPNILVLTTEAYGGRGGIARYTRDLLGALSTYRAGTGSIHVIPRRIVDDPEPPPPNVHFDSTGARGRWGFLRALCRALVGRPRFDLVICGHILLLPGARLAAWWHRCPLVLFGYGIDVWEATRGRRRNAMAQRVDARVVISRVTAERMAEWSPFPDENVHLLPPCIDLEAFSPGPRNPKLMRAYGLRRRRVLLTMARLDSRERYKGVDETLDVLPELISATPALTYLIVGDGDDRERLEAKAVALGIDRNTVFTGWIEDAAKEDHYRLADAFAMPGSGEGFGIVFLEAMACGVPVLASTLDGSREAVAEGRLGLMVDPRDRTALRQALTALLQRSPGHVPAGLDTFSTPRFDERCHAILDTILGTPAEYPQPD